jgi:hypothetical protein
MLQIDSLNSVFIIFTIPFSLEGWSKKVAGNGSAVVALCGDAAVRMHIFTCLCIMKMETLHYRAKHAEQTHPNNKTNMDAKIQYEIDL